MHRIAVSNTLPMQVVSIALHTIPGPGRYLKLVFAEIPCASLVH